jgi:hypothetical protein
MMPQGAVADLVSFAEQQRLRAIHPEAQTVARLLLGRCSCDFVHPRLPDEREDERHLRERYRRLGVSRDAVIKALERHRRGADLRQPSGGWRLALVRFIAEHARNAGSTLYHLQFSPQAELGSPGDSQRLALADVLSDPEGWLGENKPTLVAR